MPDACKLGSIGEGIQWATHAEAATLDDVGVDHDRRDGWSECRTPARAALSPCITGALADSEQPHRVWTASQPVRGIPIRCFRWRLTIRAQPALAAACDNARRPPHVAALAL
jgi:hypothetical protein